MDANDSPVDRFCGAVLGAAVADALALPLLHHSRRFLQSQATALTDAYREPAPGVGPAGQFASGTQVLRALLEATFEQVEDESDPGPSPTCALAHLLPLWRDQTLIEGDPACAEALRPLLGRPWPPRPVPLPVGRAEAAPLVRAIVPGLRQNARLELALSKTDELVLLTHSDPRPRACAAAVTAAIAHLSRRDELLLGEFLDAVAVAAARQDEKVSEALLDMPRILSMTEVRCERHFERVYADPAYPDSQEGLGYYAVPTLLSSIYYFLKNPMRFDLAVEHALRLGGNMGTCALLTGALCGAFAGGESIPEPLVADLLDTDELRALATRLWRATRNPTDADPDTAKSDDETIESDEAAASEDKARPRGETA